MQIHKKQLGTVTGESTVTFQTLQGRWADLSASAVQPQGAQKNTKTLPLHESHFTGIVQVHCALDGEGAFTNAGSFNWGTSLDTHHLKIPWQITAVTNIPNQCWPNTVHINFKKYYFLIYFNHPSTANVSWSKEAVSVPWQADPDLSHTATWEHMDYFCSASDTLNALWGN